MHYSNFRYLAIWFWFAMCCVMPESDVAAGKYTQASITCARVVLFMAEVVLACCAGRVEP